MEPTIKSEPCEELYSEQAGGYQVSNIMEGGETMSPQTQTQNSLKRLYEEMENNAPVNGNMNQQPNNSNYQSFEFPSAPKHLQNNVNIQESNQTAASSEGKLKKFKKLEANVLFNPPFFNLVEELFSPNSDAIAARCYTCGKVVKGNRGISSNFIKHMKRGHPQTYKLYDGYKSHKTKSYYLPNLPETVTRKSAANIENGASGSDSTTANSNDDTNQFFETNAVLEGTGVNDSSDDNDDLIKATKPTNTTDKNLEFSPKALEALGNIIDEKLKKFVKQKEYDELNEKVNALNKTNTGCNVGPNPDLAELKTELDTLKKECSELRSVVQISHASKRQLQNELSFIDKRLHQRKLIIRNISVCDPKNPLKSVEKLFKETMHLENIKIVNCCIIPSTKTSLESNKGIVSIELASPKDCKAIFGQIQKLKNTGIFVESEISPFQRKRKNKLMVLRKELLRRKPDLKVLVRDTTLLVNGKKFYWDDVEGLCHDCNCDTMNLNGVQYLNLTSGVDLKEFIIFLQNYNVQIT